MKGYDESALQLLTALAEPSRWRILKMLQQKPAKSISHIARAMGISTTAAANQITVLEKAKLVSRKKPGGRFTRHPGDRNHRANCL